MRDTGTAFVRCFSLEMLLNAFLFCILTLSLYSFSQSGTRRKAKRRAECAIHVKEIVWRITTSYERYNNVTRHEIQQCYQTQDFSVLTHQFCMLVLQSKPARWYLPSKDTERQRHNQPAGKRKLVE